MTRALLLAALTLLAAPTVGVAGEAPALAASDAWIALGPPGSATLAGYLTLHNPRPTPAALVGVESPAFGRIELHSVYQDAGTMRMRRLAKLDVPAGGRLVLGPGRIHLMLFAPSTPLGAGQRVPLELSFDDGTTLAVEAEVRDPRGAPDHPVDR